MTLQIKVKKKIFFAEQESVLNNAEVLIKERRKIINQFTKRQYNFKGVRNFFMHLKRLEKVHLKKGESFFELIKVSKDKLDSIKLKISRNKHISTTIDKERYTLSDVNDLINKKKQAKLSAGMRLLTVTMVL